MFAPIMKATATCIFGTFIDDGLRGTVRLSEIDRDRTSAHVGILLFDINYWGWDKGWGFKACGAVFLFASEVLGLSRLRAGHIAENMASRKFLAEVGFQYCAGQDWMDEGQVTHHFWLLDLPARQPGAGLSSTSQE